MERKIIEQKKEIEALYDDLESREKFIEMLEGDLKKANRQAEGFGRREKREYRK